MAELCSYKGMTCSVEETAYDDIHSIRRKAKLKLNLKFSTLQSVKLNRVRGWFMVSCFQFDTGGDAKLILNREFVYNVKTTQIQVFETIE